MNDEPNIVVGLDLGTTKVCAIVGELTEKGGISIIGVGSHPSHGLKRGVVVNIEETVKSIKKAVEEAEHMSGCEIRTVFTGIAGGHIKGITGHGMVTIRNEEVDQVDVDRVIESASALLIPTDREILHLIPQEYMVDGNAGIQDPIGIYGIKLEAKIHVVTGQVTAAQNLVKCIHLAGMDVADICIEQLASSESVLTKDEREIGVLLIDIGGGTTDLGIFYGGTIRHIENLTLGGDHVDRDIALGLSTPLASARDLKEAYGNAYADLVDHEEMIEIESVGGRSPRTISRRDLAMIIEPRMEEIFHMVKREVIKSGYDEFIPGGAIITGGTVNMDGALELAEDTLSMPVRKGVPNSVGGLRDLISNPIYSTGVGLVIQGTQHEGSSKLRIGDTNVLKNVFDSMKHWFREFV